MARLFGCSRDTVMRGIKELNETETLPQNRSRRAGGGRTPVLEQQPAIDEVFLLLLKEHTAGDPMDEKIKWTDLTCAQISTFLAQQGFKVSRNSVKRLLKKRSFVKRKALKKVCWRSHKP